MNMTPFATAALLLALALAPAANASTPNPGKLPDACEPPMVPAIDFFSDTCGDIGGRIAMLRARLFPGSTFCTARVNADCTLDCSFVAEAPAWAVDVFAFLEGESGSVTTTATGDCVAGGSFSVTDDQPGIYGRGKSVTTYGMGQITCQVRGTAPGYGECRI